MQHPAVVDAAVSAGPTNAAVRSPVAYVVTNADVTTAELDGWIAPRLAPYKRPTAIHPVDDLPRTSSGKLLRRKLREHALA